jgi:glucuronate isomerase
LSQDQLARTVEEGLAAVPVLDVHTHIDAGHLTARGLHDVLLYHMVISDLASAGCPSLDRLSEEPQDAEVEARLSEAIPYVRHIQNTSGFWGVRIVLQHLYGIAEPITEDNWRRAHAQIRERSGDSAWAREIALRAGVRRAGTELWRRKDGSADDLLQYALEWAFFTRAQWGVNDIPLYELERAWNQPYPDAPLPVTMSSRRPELARTIRTLDDIRSAIQHYTDRIPYGRVLSTAQHLSTDLTLRTVSDSEMQTSLARRDRASIEDRDVYASYILEAFLTALEEHGSEIVYQFSIGAEPLPHETGSKLRQETISDVAAIVAKHPRLRFQAFLASEHANQAFCTLARELPNLSLAGYWWHNLYPGIIRKVISDRLDMVAANKQIGFFSDAYCLDWTYAKSVIVRKQLAAVLAAKIAQGQYTPDQALEIARQILFESPQSLLGLRPG